jgi:hypothetical protein
MLNTFLEAESKLTCLNYKAILALSRASRKVRLCKMLLTLTVNPTFYTGGGLPLGRQCFGFLAENRSGIFTRRQFVFIMA